MSAIFPPFNRGGVPPGPNVCNAYTPTNPVIGEGPNYVAPDCTTVLTDCQLNAITSEILAAVDELGFGFNSSNITNLGDALAAKFNAMQLDFDSRVRRSGDTMTGELLVVCPPLNDNAATCKSYVDQVAADAQACCDTKVSKSGDTMTGPLILSGDATDSHGAVTLQQLEVAIAGMGSATVIVAPSPPWGAKPDTLWWDSTTGILYILFDDGSSVQWVQIRGGGGGGGTAPSGDYLPLSGGALTGPLYLSSPIPTAGLEAVPKSYVDNLFTNFDAPADGKLYARRDNAWEEVSAGLFDDAPEDGEVYGRKDGTWVQVTTAFDVDGGVY